MEPIQASAGRVDTHARGGGRTQLSLALVT